MGYNAQNGRGLQEVVVPVVATLEDEFGDIIKKARRGLSYSSQDIFRLSGVSSDALNELESYRRRPTDSEITALAQLLHLDERKLADIARSNWFPRKEPWTIESSAALEIIPVNVNGYTENCYVVGCERTRRAFIVDPGGSVDAIAAAVKSGGWMADAILLTHEHSDHTVGIAGVTSHLGSGVIIGHPDALKSADNGGLPTRAAQDGDEFRIGELRPRVLHTPGHTFASCCYVSGLLCFVGDTLFAGSVGGAGGGPAAYQMLLESIRKKLLNLPSDTALLPGHGPATTVAEQLAHNPFF